MFSSKCYCALDIGASRIKAGILKCRDIRKMELVEFVESKTSGFAVKGVGDFNAFSEGISKTLNQLTNNSSLRWKDVWMGVGGTMINSRETSAQIPFMEQGNKLITSRDIQNINTQARLLGVKMEEEILHDLPQYYHIDDTHDATNPQGLYARKLEVRSLMITAGSRAVANIVRAVHQAGYEVANIAFSTYTSAEIVLTHEDKMNGCVFIDIGASQSSVLIFKETLRYIDKISIGGDHFTNNISDQLNLSIDLAEEIKKSYASAFNSETAHSEEILVKKNGAYLPIKRQKIHHCIEPQIEILVKSVHASIKASGLYGQMNQGIVVSGVGALLPGLMERIAKATNMSVKLAKMNNITYANDDLLALPVAGLAYNGFKKSLHYSVSSDKYNHLAGRVVNRVKELYEEYF